MSDPLKCLRVSTIVISIWNIIYSLIQIGIFLWQTKEVKDLQWEFENRQIPANGFVDGFQARFPGLYALYTETPERRRINAMYVIVLICDFLAIVHLLASCSALYGAIKNVRTAIFPFLFTGWAIVIMSTAYAVLWWSGDVFNEQLVMSVAEFVMSLAVNGICLIVVIFYYTRLAGGLTSDKPAGERRKRKRQKEYIIMEKPTPRHSSRSHPAYRTPYVYPPPSSVNPPPWRTEWEEKPPEVLHRKMKRKEHREQRQLDTQRRKRMEENGIDLCAPETYDPSFPWKMAPPPIEIIRENERPRSAANCIKELYYEDYPSERPPEREPRPRGRRGRSLERDGRERGRSPERVTFSRGVPEVYYRTPEDTPSTVKGQSHQTVV